MKRSLIFTGYDAVDNDYFSSRSHEARKKAHVVRARLGLPEKYFLSLGRMIPKKNLPTLVRAYTRYCNDHPNTPHHLVFVGAGETEQELRDLCAEFGIPITDHSTSEVPPHGLSKAPGVHFYGFRQIEENPYFYALATAFVLPSSTEEWGLVVNEAMACGLPVIVSQTAGCAEDLVINGENGYTFDPASVEDLAAALTSVSNPQSAARMGEKSFEIIRHRGCDYFAEGALNAAAAAAAPLKFLIKKHSPS